MKLSEAKVTVARVPDGFFETPYGNKDDELVTPLQAIRRFCLDCQGGRPEITLDDGKKMKAYRPYREVKACMEKSCWLWNYRTGRRKR